MDDLPAVIKMFSDKVASNRTKAIEISATIGNESAVKPLVQVVEDKRRLEADRVLALRVLAKIESDAVMPALKKLRKIVPKDWHKMIDTELDRIDLK